MGQKTPFYADVMACHDEVTGSCILVSVNNPNKTQTRFMIDCGLGHGKEMEIFNEDFPFNPENFEFAIVTHNHVDHTGRLPLLAKKWFEGNIYVSRPTSKLLPHALYDSLKVLRSVAKNKNSASLYEEEDVKKALNLVVPIDYDVTFSPCENIKVTMFKNGHLVGAAVVLIQISYPGYDDINILFSGDYNKKNVFFEVKKLPDWVKKLQLTVVCESTYGSMNTNEIKKVFNENVIKAIEEQKTVVMPVFSLGRMQETLLYLKNMQKDGSISKDIPIYVDGKLGLKYTKLYSNKELEVDVKDFEPQGMFIVDKRNRGFVLKSVDTKIIVTTSGMGTYGPAQEYIPEYLQRRNALIHFMGYCAEGTLGYKLKEAKNNSAVEINGVLIKKRAQVEFTNEFSAHAKADELIEFLQQFQNLKLCLVNHGEVDVKKKFADRVLNEVEVKNVGILNREYVFRICPYGFVKTISTKFI